MNSPFNPDSLSHDVTLGKSHFLMVFFVITVIYNIDILYTNHSSATNYFLVCILVYWLQGNFIVW